MYPLHGPRRKRGVCFLLLLSFAHSGDAILDLVDYCANADSEVRIVANAHGDWPSRRSYKRLNANPRYSFSFFIKMSRPETICARVQPFSVDFRTFL